MAMDTNKFLTNLTLGEVAKIEELSGQSIAQLGEDEAPMGLMLAAFVFVVKRRTDRSFSWNDAHDVTMPDAMAILNGGPVELENADAAGDAHPEQVDPTPAT